MLHPSVSNIPHPKQYNNRDTGITDSGDRNIYFAKEAPIQQFNVDAPKVHVATATIQLQWYVVTGTLELTSLLSNFLCTGHVMPLFKYFFIGIGSICDADSYQGDENLLAQNGGIFLYARIQQKFLCYLLTLKGQH